MGLAAVQKRPGAGDASRDLAGAQSAYDLRDADASKDAHVAKKVGAADERHPKMGGYIKSIVYGGLDGIITTFAVVAGAAGGGFGPNIVIVMGVSSLLADALSMGVGDALSSQAETEVAKREREREKWELENFKEGEIKEMVEIYQGRGMSVEDAELVVRVCAKYEDMFVDMMLVDELGLEPPDDDANPWKDGAVTFTSFCFFGFFPLAAYCMFGSVGNFDSRALFFISCVLTGVMLFVLGALKSLMTARSWWVSGLEVLFVGSMVAGVAFAIGVFIEDMLMNTGSAMGGMH